MNITTKLVLSITFSMFFSINIFTRSNISTYYSSKGNLTTFFEKPWDFNRGKKKKLWISSAYSWCKNRISQDASYFRHPL